MSDNSREFEIGDILSVTTGILVSRNHVGGLYELMGFMMGKPLFTHELPSAMDVCKPPLDEAFPELTEIVIPPWPDFASKEEAMAHIYGWLDSLEPIYGRTRSVEPLATPQRAMTPGEQLGESLDILERMAGDKPIVVVAAGVESPPA